MEFEEYLRSKKIDPKRFQQSESGLYDKWKKQFEQMHPKSFTSRNLYLINPLRRRYRIVEEAPAQKPAMKQSAKPVIKPRIKPSR